MEAVINGKGGFKQIIMWDIYHCCLFGFFFEISTKKQKLIFFFHITFIHRFLKKKKKNFMFKDICNFGSQDTNHSSKLKQFNYTFIHSFVW